MLRFSLLAWDIYSVLHAFNVQEAVVNFGGFSGNLSLSSMRDDGFSEQQVEDWHISWSFLLPSSSLLCFHSMFSSCPHFFFPLELPVTSHLRAPPSSALQLSWLSSALSRWPEVSLFL